MPITERAMTDREYGLVKAGFDQHTTEHGNPVEQAERFGFVATDGDTFLGCSSGLAERNATGYSPWFYLSDLYVEKPYRGRGVGGELLRSLEQRISTLGIIHIWTWTAGYDAPAFYARHGYEVFFEMPLFYPSGHSRFGFKKILSR